MNEGALSSPRNHNQPAIPDAGSFRDRSNRVYRAGDRIFRGVSEDALKNWQAVSAKEFFKDLLAAGKIIPTSEAGGLRVAGMGDWPAVLAHETIPFVSYPYEWPFGMLKAAALLQLEILARAIEQDWTLKDATAYNIQWIGCRPVFIDIPSFEPYQAGDPWRGYRQFCMMFLYPLMLKAYLGADFGPLLRANLDGIDPVLANRLLGGRSRLKNGVFTHVYLHAKMQEGAARKELDEARRHNENARTAPEAAKRIRHSKPMVLGVIDGLRRTVEKLKSPDQRTTWGDYATDHSYGESSLDAKKSFVDRHVAALKPRMIWDLGCNTGTFSRIGQNYAERVISIDGDATAIDRLYEQEKKSGGSKILPLIVDLSNASPNHGWRGAERLSLERRGRPDLIICLALIHHIVIAANIPMREFIGWVADLGGDLIIEFVTAEDPMSKMLLRNKVNQYQDYTVETFEALVREKYEILDREELKSGQRKIYSLRRK